MDRREKRADILHCDDAYPHDLNRNLIETEAFFRQEAVTRIHSPGNPDLQLWGSRDEVIDGWQSRWFRVLIW